MEFKDYYRTMGVSREASQDEIKRAYRKLARKYHPDVSKEKNAEERFKEIQEAYEVLRDPEKRAAYDKLGQRWRAGQEFRPPPDWDVGFDFGRAGFADGDFSEFSDFFESLFGGSRRRSASARERRQVRGQDEHARLVIDLEDAYRGATRTLNLRVPEITPEGEMRLRERNLNVRIPKGIMAGQRIRLAGQGGAGTRGGSSGDLYLEIEFRRHSLYHAEGRHIYLDLPVTPWEAALGATVVAPTLGGNVDMTIPKGSQAGRRLRLKGRGLPGNPPGDEYVVLRIVTPPATTASEEAAYRRMAKEFRFNPRANMGGR